jgi:hypothetical protein
MSRIKPAKIALGDQTVLGVVFSRIIYGDRLTLPLITRLSAEIMERIGFPPQSPETFRRHFFRLKKSGRLGKVEHVQVEGSRNHYHFKSATASVLAQYMGGMER